MGEENGKCSVVCGIYKITNKKTKKVYIGSSENLKKRFYDHRSDLENNRHKNFKLQNSWNKHGSSEFAFEIILFCREDDLIQNEQMFIDFHSTESMYNICLIAGNTKGYKHTEESKIKIGKNSLGNKHSLGRKLSDDHKKIIKESLKARVITKETREKLSKIHKGKPKSEDHKRKIAETLKGVPLPEKARINSQTPEAIEKRRQKLLGRPLSEDHKKKLKGSRTEEGTKAWREKMVGRKQTESHMINAREGRRKRREKDLAEKLQKEFNLGKNETTVSIVVEDIKQQTTK